MCTNHFYIVSALDARLNSPKCFTLKVSFENGTQGLYTSHGSLEISVRMLYNLCDFNEVLYLFITNIYLNLPVIAARRI